MKGIVFTEFLEMVEREMGMDMTDRIITAATLPNSGAYTSVGTYDHRELVRLIGALSEATGKPASDLVRGFGEYLFQRFTIAYSSFFEGVNTTFEFLRNVDRYVHVEVRKLYPDAELPSFRYENPSVNELVLQYESPRGFGDLAEGLIRGCIAHYKESIRLTRADLPVTDGKHRVRFHLVRETA